MGSYTLSLSLQLRIDSLDLKKNNYYFSNSLVLVEHIFQNIKFPRGKLIKETHGNDNGLEIIPRLIYSLFSTSVFDYFDYSNFFRTFIYRSF